MIFDGDSDLSSPTSSFVTYLWRVGRHLAQNWSNMMKNGAKHSPPGGIIQNPCPPPVRRPRDPLTNVFICQIKSKFKS